MGRRRRPLDSLAAAALVVVLLAARPSEGRTGSCAKDAQCDGRAVCAAGRCTCPALNAGRAGLSTGCRTRVKGLPDACFPLVSDRRYGPRVRRDFRVLGSKSKTDLPDLLESFGRCAVVGSSASLLKQSYGPSIDRADVVFRFNDAPATPRFAKQVGRKTTVRLQNNKYCGFVDARWRGLPVYCLPYTYGMSSLSRRCIDVIRRSTCRQLQPSPRLRTYVGSHWGGGLPEEALKKYSKTLPEKEVQELKRRKLSAGYTGVALALSLCAQVDIYGFDSGDTHYYKKTAGETSQKATTKSREERHLWHGEKECMGYLRKGVVKNVKVW